MEQWQLIIIENGPSISYLNVPQRHDAWMLMGSLPCRSGNARGQDGNRFAPVTGTDVARLSGHRSRSTADAPLIQKQGGAKFTMRQPAINSPRILLIGPYDPHCGEYTFLAPPLGVWRLAGVLKKG